MTEVQKVSVCKFCSGEITWSKDAVSGKNYPKNLNGSPHLCKKAATTPDKTPAQIAAEQAAYNAKAQAAGFQTGAQVQQEQKAQPQTQPAGKPENCTSPDTPAGTGLTADARSAPKTLKGSVTSVNAGKNLLIVEDTDGITHGFTYPAELDLLVKKQKPGWFVEVTYRNQGDRELLADVKYAERPAGQRKGGYGGGKTYQPRNDKAIILQTCMKVAADVLIARGFCEDNDPPFEDQMVRITTEAIKAADAICKAGGVA